MQELADLPIYTYMRVLDRKQRLRLSAALLICVFLQIAGCGFRTIPPIKWVPIFGKENEVQTTAVLVLALRDQDVAVRAQAIALLGVLAQAGDKETKIEVARVLGMALKDQDPGLRVQVVEGLGAMDSEFANKYLIGALRDRNPFVRAKVLEVVSQRERKSAIGETADNPLSAQIP